MSMHGLELLLQPLVGCRDHRCNVAGDSQFSPGFWICSVDVGLAHCRVLHFQSQYTRLQAAWNLLCRLPPASVKRSVNAAASAAKLFYTTGDNEHEVRLL